MEERKAKMAMDGRGRTVSFSNWALTVTVSEEGGGWEGLDTGEQAGRR